eukprot:4552866-Pyramimonas_sp.AAC.2
MAEALKRAPAGMIRIFREGLLKQSSSYHSRHIHSFQVQTSCAGAGAGAGAGVGAGAGAIASDRPRCCFVDIGQNSSNLTTYAASTTRDSSSWSHPTHTLIRSDGHRRNRDRVPWLVPSQSHSDPIRWSSIQQRWGALAGPISITLRSDPTVVDTTEMGCPGWSHLKACP